ncbi:hypothetical protein RRG08_056278 [Elysia crispata]|uniref:Secreted protein n=1 Tax=Elysia crispata TaxID=231223 RepID=A0AAE1AW88_9GAST|nr:hypothetical protein RRG08_056278 [Elysia crispata]
MWQSAVVLVSNITIGVLAITEEVSHAISSGALEIHLAQSSSSLVTLDLDRGSECPNKRLDLQRIASVRINSRDRGSECPNKRLDLQRIASVRINSRDRGSECPNKRLDQHTG